MVVEGFTVGLAVLGLIIFDNGVQLKTPVPLAFSCTTSGLQINVSLKASVIIGLSRTSIVVCTVSIQPKLLVTMSETSFSSLTTGFAERLIGTGSTLNFRNKNLALVLFFYS